VNQEDLDGETTPPPPVPQIIVDLMKDEATRTTVLAVRVHSLEMQMRVAVVTVIILATINAVLTGIDLVSRLLSSR